MDGDHYIMDNNSKQRYGRQLILPEFGMNGQTKLSESSVLIIGAGGLGCPCAIYLAAAGVGRIGLVDHDTVDTSNLHRQVQHKEKNVGVAKVDSLADACLALNSTVDLRTHRLHLDSSNAIDICKPYDVLVDCTDNVASRYLINDVAVLTSTPLVSGSALRFEGQLTIYNYKGGPCYRCLFPRPPPPETVTNCSDGGVIGTTPGVIGTLQAQEVIKIISDLPSGFEGKMLLFDSLECSFRRINLRSKVHGCAVCGPNATIKSPIDYNQFCGTASHDHGDDVHILGDGDRISVKEFHKLNEISDFNLPLIDIRPTHELEITKLRNTINIPYVEVMKIKNFSELLKFKEDILNGRELYIICRRGNDSQKAVVHLREILATKDICVRDLIGGLYEWHHQIDETIAIY